MTLLTVASISAMSAAAVFLLVGLTQCIHSYVCGGSRSMGSTPHSPPPSHGTDADSLQAIMLRANDDDDDHSDNYEGHCNWKTNFAPENVLLQRQILERIILLPVGGGGGRRRK